MLKIIKSPWKKKTEVMANNLSPGDGNKKKLCVIQKLQVDLFC
jgi:hypothetical protein